MFKDLIYYQMLGWIPLEMTCCFLKFVNLTVVHFLPVVVQPLLGKFLDLPLNATIH